MCEFLRSFPNLFMSVPTQRRFLMKMLSAAPPLPPEIWNLAVVLTVCMLLGWMARLLRLTLVAADLRYAVDSRAVLHLKGLGVSLNVLRSASMWHFHQLLRTTTEATSTKMARIQIPFDVVSSSLDIKRVGGAESSMILSFKIQSHIPCTAQVYWGVQSDGLDELASGSDFVPRDPLGRDGQSVISPRRLIPPVLRQVSIDRTMRAIRSMPSRLGSRIRRQRRRHELRDDTVDEANSSPTREATPCPKSPVFADQSDIFKCHAYHAQTDIIIVPISTTASVCPAQDELQSLMEEIDSHSPVSTVHRGNAVSLSAPRFAGVIVLRSASPPHDSAMSTLFGKLSARQLTVDPTAVVCHCIALDFLPTPVKPERFTPVIVKKISYTKTAAFAPQEIYGPDASSASECTICLEGLVSIVLLPCRHSCVCSVCLREIDRCPICRANFTTYVAYDNVDDGNSDAVEVKMGTTLD